MSRRRLARPLLAAGLLGAALALPGCTTVRNALGPHESACFRVLPTADAAVGATGSYEGVRFVPAGDLLTDIRRQTTGPPVQPVPASLRGIDRISVCLVEYKGDYQLASLTDGWSPSGAETGHYAVVVIRQSDDQILATALLLRPPLRFSRTYPT